MGGGQQDFIIQNFVIDDWFLDVSKTAHILSGLFLRNYCVDCSDVYDIYEGHPIKNETFFLV